MHAATLRLRFNSPEEARRLAASLAPENGEFLDVRLDGPLLIATAQADAPLTLMRTLDDALACLSAAERAGRLGEPAAIEEPE